MLYTGIDCGLDGGISLVDTDGKLLQSMVMPTISNGKGRKIDLKTLNEYFDSASTYSIETFIVEDPGGHAPSAAGLRSMTYSFAVVEALLVAHELRYITIPSQKWQKEFWNKPKMPKGKKFNTKAAALITAQKIFPTEKWLKSKRCTKPHDGMIDAALLAEYGRRKGL